MHSLTHPQHTPHAFHSGVDMKTRGEIHLQKIEKLPGGINFTVCEGNPAVPEVPLAQPIL